MSIELKAGNYYLDRDDEIIGPIYQDEFGMFFEPHPGPTPVNQIRWYKNGRVHRLETNRNDLIELYIKPPENRYGIAKHDVELINNNTGESDCAKTFSLVEPINGLIPFTTSFGEYIVLVVYKDSEAWKLLDEEGLLPKNSP